jgi:hypothetical protein
VVKSSLGDWAPTGEPVGAEPSTISIYRGQIDPKKFKYASSKKGLISEQIQVINFLFDNAGEDSLWSIDVKGKLAEVRNNLDHHGLAYRTLQALGNGRIRVYITDIGTGLDEPVRRFSYAFGAGEAKRFRGNGEFWPPELDTSKSPGSEEQKRRLKRAHAIREYRKFIKEYEEESHQTGP